MRVTCARLVNFNSVVAEDKELTGFMKPVLRVVDMPTSQQSILAGNDAARFEQLRLAGLAQKAGEKAELRARRDATELHQTPTQQECQILNNLRHTLPGLPPIDNFYCMALDPDLRM